MFDLTKYEHVRVLLILALLIPIITIPIIAYAFFFTDESLEQDIKRQCVEFLDDIVSEINYLEVNKVSQDAIRLKLVDELKVWYYDYSIPCERYLELYNEFKGYLPIKPIIGD